MLCTIRTNLLKRLDYKINMDDNGDDVVQKVI